MQGDETIAPIGGLTSEGVYISPRCVARVSTPFVCKVAGSKRVACNTIENGEEQMGYAVAILSVDSVECYRVGAFRMCGAMPFVTIAGCNLDSVVKSVATGMIDRQMQSVDTVAAVGPPVGVEIDACLIIGMPTPCELVVFRGAAIIHHRAIDGYIYREYAVTGTMYSTIDRVFVQTSDIDSTMAEFVTVADRWHGGCVGSIVVIYHHVQRVDTVANALDSVKGSVTILTRLGYSLSVP